MADQVAKLESHDSILLRHIGRNASSISRVNSYVAQQVARLDLADANLQTQIGQISSTIVTLNSNIGRIETVVDSHDESIAGLVEADRNNLRDLTARLDAINSIASWVINGNEMTVTLTDGEVRTFSITGPRGPEGPTGPRGAGGGDGTAGTQGPQGNIGPAGSDGAPGAAGQDGVSVTGVALGAPDANGCRDLSFSFSDNTVSPAGQVCDGADGEDGEDGAAGNGGSADLNWTPAFGAQTATFDQEVIVGGTVIATRTITISASAPVETAGASSESVTYDGFATLALAQAEYTTPGTYQIDVVTTTSYAVGTSVITYSGDNGFVSHSVSSAYQKDPSSVTTQQSYTVAADPADVWSVTGTYGGEVTEGQEFEANVVTESGAPTSQASLTVTFDIHRNDAIAAAGNVETLAVNGDLDAANAGLSNGDTREVETAAATTSLTIVSTGNTRQIANPAYQAPQDPADVWANNGDTTGGDDINIRNSGSATERFFSGENNFGGATTEAGIIAWINENIAAGLALSYQYEVTQPRIKDVTAVYNVEELTVNGAADVAGTATGDTRQGSVHTAAQTGVAHTADVTRTSRSHTSTGPSSTGFDFTTAVSVGIGSVNPFGGSVTVYDSADNEIGTAVAAGGRSKSFSITVPAAGSYYFSYYADSVALATNDITYVDFTVDADGNATLD